MSVTAALSRPDGANGTSISDQWKRGGSGAEIGDEFPVGANSLVLPGIDDRNSLERTLSADTPQHGVRSSGFVSHLVE